MDSNLLSEIKRALARMVDYSQIKKPTEEQKEQYEADLLLLREHYDDVFNHIVGKSIERIKTTFKNGFNYYYDILNNDATRPPVLPQPITDVYINEIAIPHVYQAQTSVLGALEILESYLGSWESAYTRAKEFHRLLYLADAQWKADAAFHLVFDPEAYDIITELAAVVKSFRSRKDSLDKAQSNISRLVTLRTSTPTRQLTSYAGQGIDSYLDSRR